MEIIEIVNMFKSVPGYVWIILAITIIVLFGQRKVWEFEMKFSSKGVGHGEVEIECTSSKLNKKEKMSIEVDLGLEPDWRNKAYEVFLNGKSILKISESESASFMNVIRKKYAGEKPNVGDQIEIRCEQQTVFSGELYRD